nr:hypothetical protein [Tanacetum cinerariifolium]
MVVFLKKLTRSEGFQEIVDFLNESHIRQALNEDTELPQTSVPIPNVPDETVYKEWDDIIERATITVASLDATQDNGNILKTQSMTMPNVPLPRRISTCGSLRCQETMGVLLLRLGLRGQGSSFGDKLKADEESIWYCYTKLIMKVKKLEKNVRSNQARRKTKIIVSDDEEDSKDSSKQGRMIEDIDLDARITLVTPTKVSSQEYQLKDQLGVLSVAKVIADAAKKKVNTYTRRRRAVSTGSEGVNTASRIFSTAEESVSTAGESMPDGVQAQIQADEELAQKMLEEERGSLSIVERAKLLAELIDKRKKLQAAH